MLDVFVARIASARHAAASSANSLCFSGRLSVAAYRGSASCTRARARTHLDDHVALAQPRELLDDGDALPRRARLVRANLPLLHVLREQAVHERERLRELRGRAVAHEHARHARAQRRDVRDPEAHLPRAEHAERAHAARASAWGARARSWDAHPCWMAADMVSVWRRLVESAGAPGPT
jgi:hypothetical protein